MVDGDIPGSPTASVHNNSPARITATMSAMVARGIVLSGRLVSSAAWDMDSRPMNDTIATVMPHPKLVQDTPVPSWVMLWMNVGRFQTSMKPISNSAISLMMLTTERPMFRLADSLMPM